MIGTLLSHYRVVEQIGAGGMGVIFRAHDEQLERDVAIKVLPTGMLGNEAAHKRFRREAMVLARLNHPNIGVIFEFGSQGGTDFLVMELISGVSLDHKLSGGALPQKDVLRLGIQLAEGLLVAHEQGIIHRDLKPANLRLTPDGRLKILDFGLALLTKLDAEAALTESVGERASLTGTLPYMAPEQLRGESGDMRADIWAMGAVLYEMATGKRPFPERHVPLLIDSILNKDPESPVSFNSKVSPGLEYLILKCLDKDPDRRYQTVRELRVDLERLTAPISQVPRSSSSAQEMNALTAAAVRAGIEEAKRKEQEDRKRRVKTALAWVAALLMVVLVVVVAFRFFKSVHPIESAASRVRPRRSIAVLGLRNLSGDPQAAWLSTALAEMLTTEMGAGEKLRTISGEDVAHLRLDLAMPENDTFNVGTLSLLGRNLGADLVVSGSYLRLSGGQIRLNLRLQDVGTGEVLAALPETGQEATLFDLIGQAGGVLREKSGAGNINPSDQAAVRALLPSGSEAARPYTEGLAHLRVFDAIGARDLLQKAVGADPNYALAHSALAAAWSALGYDERARQSAKNAFDLAANLPREDRLLVEARYRENSKEWDSAAGIYRTLFGFFPDNLEYGILLARSQSKAGHAKDALGTIDSVRRLPPPAGVDPRISLAAAEASQALGDSRQMLSFATEGAERAKSKGGKLVLARALYLTAAAHENLSQATEAARVAEEARRIYSSVGDLMGVASTLEVSALVLADQGNLSGALDKYKEELEIARKLGNRRAESSALNNMALVVDEQGDRKSARSLWEQALAGFRDISDKNNSVSTLVNIGGVFKDQGDHASARKTYEEALALAREINDQGGISLTLTSIATVLDAQGEFADAKKMLNESIALDASSGQTNPAPDKLIDLGDVLQHLGDLAGASDRYQQALRLAQTAGDRSMSAYALMGLSSVALKGADFNSAEKDLEHALALRRELGENDEIAKSQASWAELLVEQGRAHEAEAGARSARDHLREVGLRDDEISAASVLIEALLSENKTGDADREVAVMAARTTRCQNLAVRLDFELAAAQTRIATGRFAGAREQLGSVVAKATKAGLIGEQFEARLLLGRIKLRTGDPHSSATELQRLGANATERGFLLLARKAGANMAP